MSRVIMARETLREHQMALAKAFSEYESARTASEQRMRKEIRQAHADHATRMSMARASLDDLRAACHEAKLGLDSEKASAPPRAPGDRARRRNLLLACGIAPRKTVFTNPGDSSIHWHKTGSDSANYEPCTGQLHARSNLRGVRV